MIEIVNYIYVNVVEEARKNIMAKGSEAKEYVIRKIKETFGEDFVGEQDKKIYVWGQEGGEKVQIAISLTCPKNPIGSLNFEEKEKIFEEENKVVEITEEEKTKIDELMTRLGI